MPDSFDIIDPDLFTVGAVGPPGQRTFYVQAVSAGEAVSLKCEKGQVEAMGEYFNGMLTGLDPSDWKTIGDVELVEPVESRFVLGQVGVAYDPNVDRVVIVAEELVPEDEEGASARFMVTRDQVRAFVRRARTLVAASRQNTNGHH